MPGHALETSLRRAPLGAGVLLITTALASTPLAAQGPQTFNACFVPSVGALYLIKQTGLPAACLAGSHVEIAWTQGGDIADLSVTTAKIADGAVTAAKLAAGLGAGTVTDLTAGAGLLGGTITSSGTLDVDFGGPGSAATVARSDHTHQAGGTGNVGVGNGTLLNNTTGTQNTALGSNALRNNGAGSENTAVGAGTMDGSAGLGIGNTAVGAFALRAPTGDNNTAVGNRALRAITAGENNTAIGHAALMANTVGNHNTAIGWGALDDNTTGFSNVAIGALTLGSNVDGVQNTAVGQPAMRDNISGRNNAAFARGALQRNTTGDENTAVGFSALTNNTTGNRNIAIGNDAGINATTGDDNIYIGAPGGAGEGGTIRLGAGGTHTRTFIAGIRSITTGSSNAITVLIDGNGQLGTINSSRRFKTDIRDMAEISRALLALRPVSFRYRDTSATGAGPVTYGLIAEEVEDAFPDLVAYGADGRPETVRYHLLPSLLLNEVQRQQRELESQQAEIGTLYGRIEALTAAIQRLEAAAPGAGR